ncbi:hypothetical protein [Dokdonia pacifica]|uniref:hypothetical protein n=1 Tax=Dokdonia pacifica TaxID=1627892 RepID=UPI00166E765E|nr:hypothetical protein [Dokdonia pacifica]
MIYFFSQVFLASSQESYKVLYMNGDVYANNTLISIGDKIKDSDSLNFIEEKGLIKVCYSKCKKLRIFSNYFFKKNHIKTISDYTKYYKSLTTRGDKDFIKNVDLKVISEHQIAIIDTLKLNSKEFNLTSDRTNFYYVSYTFKKKEINKKLDYFKNHLIFTNSIYSVENEGKIIPDNNTISLFHYNANKRESTPIVTNLNIHFFDRTVLLKKIKNCCMDTKSNLSLKNKMILLKEYLKTEYSEMKFSENDINKLLNDL